MKVIDLYESEFLTNEDDIMKYMFRTFRHFDPNKLKIESDGLVYNGDLKLIVNIDKLKVQFKEITGYFDCSHTIISDLKGCPQTVRGYFNFHNTKITSLKDCPKSISGTFYCRTIEITDPKEYRWALYCEIGGEFNSSNEEVSKIINTYAGSVNRKHWPYAINLLSKVKL